MPRISVNPKIAIVGAQLLGILPKKIQVFTGTLASPEIFPGKSLAQPDPVSFAETRLALEAQKPRVTVLPISDFKILSSTKEKVAALYGSRENPFESIIDLAGVFSGIKDNEEVAREMLLHPRWQQRTPPLQGVTFYNKANELKILLKGVDSKLEVKDLDPENPPVPREAYISFWDQMRTTGSNIKHAPTANAVTTLDGSTGSKSHDQAVWRLRDIPKQQRIEYVMTGNVATVVRQILPEKQAGDFNSREKSHPGSLLRLHRGQAGADGHLSGFPGQSSRSHPERQRYSSQRQGERLAGNPDANDNADANPGSSAAQRAL